MSKPRRARNVGRAASGTTGQVQEPESKLDPYPFLLYQAVFTAITTAAGVLAVVQGRQVVHLARSDRRRKRVAAAHRWEADLVELEQLLDEAEEFVKEQGGEFPETGQALEPLQSPLYLTPKARRAYAGLVKKLLNKAAKLNDSSFGLMSELDSGHLMEYLRNSLESMRTSLRSLRQMNSVAESLGVAKQAVQLLRKVAEYLREGLLD